MVDTKIYKPMFGVLGILFLLMFGWWVILLATGHNDSDIGRLWGAAYGLIALLAGLYGLYAARAWGLFRSHIGKAIIFLSIGLLLQEFGQLVFSFYNVVQKVEVPYPSIADIGFFGAIPAYILGALSLMKGLGVLSIVKKNYFKMVLGLTSVIIVLVLSYIFFLKGYDASQKDLLTIFLDLGYPIGQACYVSLAFITVLSLGRMLGGIMKWPIFVLLSAFALQYVADFNFLYQASKGTWTVSGYGDLLYLLAYFVMGTSLIYLSRSLSKAFARPNSSPDTK